MKKIVSGVIAGLAAAALLAAPAHAGPTVTVRVEGAAGTLLERTQVTLPDVPDPCSGRTGTVAQALDVATGGNWDRQPLVNTILGETHDFVPDSDYWALWNGTGGNYAFSTVEGVCDRVMAAGDEALLLVDRSPPPGYAPTAFPLGLRGVPSTVQAGTPIAVRVVRFALNGTASPAAGATVTGAAGPVTTDANGQASIVFPQPGVTMVKASAPGLVPSAGERVTVSATPVQPAPGAPGATGGARPGGPDTTAPVARIAGLKKVFARGRGPRELRGTVSADPSGIRSVRLAISRRRGARCSAFDGTRERFTAHRCGGWKSFKLGDRQAWSYLLPKRLATGRYTIRVIAIDKRGNEASTVIGIRVR